MESLVVFSNEVDAIGSLAITTLKMSRARDVYHCSERV